ncbi:MAG: Gfo/Idh/MocA family oxidoreductase [Armatimonadetes bacterium]|nr:Gfo/Idh/MocA family oxidoreductase [Armatimonadota bacterium]
MKSYRVAIVGCGRMAGSIDDEVVGYPAITLPYSHAASYANVPQMETVACADINPQALERFGRRWGVDGRYTDYREMIRVEKPDILSVTTGAPLHAEIVTFAAENGVPAIYCEKPMACSLVECDAMVEAVERHGVHFNLGTSRRYDPGCDQIRRLIEEGVLGQVQTIVAYRTGNLLHTGSHFFDLLLFFAGDAEAEFVQGSLDSDRCDLSANRSEVDLAGTAYIRFWNGMRAYALQSPLTADFEVIGDAGTARLMNNGIHWGLRVTKEQYGKNRILLPEPFPEFERKSPTVRCIEDLVHALETGDRTRGNARVARAGTELALAVVESHRQGGARVPLPMANRALYMKSK